MAKHRFRRGGRIGKYKLLDRLGEGGYAVVYRARDTVEGRDVALKLPYPAISKASFDELLREVRIVVRLDHPAILPILNADVVDDQLVIAYPLGHESLAERLKRRIAMPTALYIVEQVMEGVAYAHSKRVIHCDINPANIILFRDGSVKLADFGIARVAAHTKSLLGSGSGTVGYMAPEQAMGHPSFRSDVFTIGLVMYRLFAGELPRWPYRWPLPGHHQLRRKLTPEAIAFLRRAVTLDERRRFRNAASMLRAYEALGQVLR